MKIFKKILLPFFPDNQWLKEHWWHRLVKIVVLVITSTTYYSLPFLSVINLNTLVLDVPSWLASFLALPMFVPLFIIYPFISLFSSDKSSISLYILIASLIFLPSLIYRLFLYIVYSDKWKKISEK